MSGSIRESLDELRSEFEVARSDGRFSLSDYLRLTAQGCQLVEGLIHGFLDDDQQFNALVAECEKFVQDVIVPIDLTKYKVPPFVERFIIDPQLVQGVRPILEAIRASLQDEKAPDAIGG